MTRAERVAELRQSLVAAERYDGVLTKFLDLVETDRHFVTDSTIYSSQVLTQVVGMALRQVMVDVGQPKGGMARLMFLRVPALGFVHGTIHVGGCMGTVLWFEDVEVGLLAVGLPDKRTRFTRFRLGPPFPLGAPERN